LRSRFTTSAPLVEMFSWSTMPTFRWRNSKKLTPPPSQDSSG